MRVTRSWMRCVDIKEIEEENLFELMGLSLTG